MMQMDDLKEQVFSWQKQIIKDGGLTNEKLQEGCFISEMIGEYGDILLFGGKNSKELWELTSKGIAILSMAPGGIDIFGEHFEYELDS